MKLRFLPQWYLRELCNAEDKLYTLDIDLLKFKPKVFSQTKITAGVCRSIDCYKIEGDFET